MSRIFSIRMGDRLPYLAYNFGFSLVGALGVTFSAREEPLKTLFIDRQAAIIGNGTYIVNGVSKVYVPADGVAFYPWAALDTSVLRKSAMGLFHINWAGNLQESMPSEGYERFEINDNF